MCSGDCLETFARDIPLKNIFSHVRRNIFHVGVSRVRIARRVSYGGGQRRGYSPWKIFENLGSFWAILRHLVAWLYKVIFWTLREAKLKMKLISLRQAKQAVTLIVHSSVSKLWQGYGGAAGSRGRAPGQYFFSSSRAFQTIFGSREIKQKAIIGMIYISINKTIVSNH